MSVLTNIKHETFIQEIVKGNSQRKAYRVAYPRSVKWKDENVDSKASTLFKSDKVMARFEELVKKSENETILSAIERKQFLSSVVKEELEKTENKMKAIDLLNKMDGVYINKVEMNGQLNNPYEELTTEELKKLIKNE